MKAIAEVAAQLRDDPRIQKDSVRVQVRETPEAELQLEVRAHSLLADWSSFLDMRHKILVSLVDTLKPHGILRHDGELTNG